MTSVNLSLLNMDCMAVAKLLVCEFKCRAYLAAIWVGMAGIVEVDVVGVFFAAALAAATSAADLKDISITDPVSERPVSSVKTIVGKTKKIHIIEEV